VRSNCSRPAPDWLRERYERDGDTAIARELDVDRKTVRRWRELDGIASKPQGRRRTCTAPIDDTSTAASRDVMLQIGERFAQEPRGGGPAPTPARLAATRSLVALRPHAVNDAHSAGDELALDDAIIATASALGLWLEHLQRVRAA
jgi:hypothetical protein